MMKTIEIWRVIVFAQHCKYTKCHSPATMSIIPAVLQLLSTVEFPVLTFKVLQASRLYMLSETRQKVLSSHLASHV